MANVNDIPTQVRDAVRKGQEAVVGTVKSWSDAIGDTIPDLTIPGADRALPLAKSAVKSAFDIAEQAVSKQRELVVGVLDTVESRLAETGKAKSNKGPQNKSASSA